MAAPYGPPLGARRRQRRAPRGVIGPIVLILLGGSLVLQNANLLPGDLWRDVGQFWPLVLVLVGVEMLLGGRLGALVVAVVAVALVGVAAVVAVTGTMGQPARAAEPQTLQQARAGARQAAITVRFGAGRLDLAALPGGQGDQLATLTYQGLGGLRPDARYQVVNGVGQLEYGLAGQNRWPDAVLPWLRGDPAAGPTMEIAVAPGIPVSLNIQTGAADAHLDLQQLDVTNLDISVGASSATIRMPSAAGSTTAHVSGGATTLSIDVPDGVSAQVRYRGGLDNIEVDETRFPAAGEHLYRSTGYDTAANRVDLTIDAGMATVRVS